jgi:hypothetical protein
MNNRQLLIADFIGIHIPKQFVTTFDLSKFRNLPAWAVDECQDPDNELYWEAWDEILKHAEFVHPDGRIFRLEQDGDLWAVRK